MAGNSVIIVAQAQSGDALQDGTVVDVTPAAEGEHTEAAPAGETHEGTVAVEHAEKTVFPPFDPSHFPSQILWFVITFAVLYVVMSRVAMPRISSILDQRRVRIEGDLREADRLRQETDRAIEAYEQALADARRRAHGIAEETRNSIKADISGKRSAVEADLARKVSEAEASIQASKAEALKSVSDIAAETARELVGRITDAPVSDTAARDAVQLAAKGSGA